VIYTLTLKTERRREEENGRGGETVNRRKKDRETEGRREWERGRNGEREKERQRDGGKKRMGEGEKR